jgi:Raf kinase inhibitor-like YbhB/YbcL family protein
MRAIVRACAALAFWTAIVACSSGGPASPTASAPVTASAIPTVTVPSPSEVSSMPASPSPAGPSASAAGPFTLSSPAFAAGGAIPRELTCDGAGGSPALTWSGAPAGTAAFVLFVDDPDARDFVHWIVLDVPGGDSGLPKGVDPRAATPQQGTNDFGTPGWGGPCPPSGTHHYRFTLTALGAPLGLDGHPGGAAVRAALRAARASVLGTAALEGTYRRG